MSKVINQPLDNVPESTKNSSDWLQNQVDYTIYGCKNPYRDEDIQSYNLINGQRDLKDFDYITKTYGIEFPAKLTHIPLIKTYLDELIGEERMMPLSWKVAARDHESLMSMNDNKVKAVMQRLVGGAQNNVNSGMKHFSTPVNDRPVSLKNHLSDEELKAIDEFQKYDWKDLKIVAADIALRYLKEAGDIMRKKNMMFRDMLITGKEFYRSYIKEMGMDPDLWICNPLNIYFLGNEEVYYLRDCERVCYKEYLSTTDCINRYGHLMDPKDQNDMLKKTGNVIFSGVEIFDSIFTGIQNSTSLNNSGYMGADIVEVAHCEWKSNTKIMFKDETEIDEATEALMIENGDKSKIKYKYRLDLYQGIRIGGAIYLSMGRVKNVCRPMDNPWYVPLTFNGILYNKRNSKPYSLVMHTKDIQDKYDILNYFLENHVALSGTKGSRIILENIPKDFGATVTERIMKYIYYKKTGLEIISTSQEGSDNQFSNYGTYDDTISQSVEVIITMMKYLEGIASKITGVPAQRIGSIQKNELVGNTELAVNQSTLTTKPIFASHQDLVKMMLNDQLNNAKISWKKSPKKIFVLGDVLSEFFTMDTASFSETDYDVILSDSGVELKQIEELKQMAESMIQAQLIDVETVVDIVTLDNVTQLKKKIQTGVESKKQDALKEMQQQLQQLQQQLQKTSQENDMLKKADREMQQNKLDMEAEKNKSDAELLDRQISVDEEIGLQKNKIEQDRVNLESLQMTFNSQAEKVRIK
jgi:hypothetical protein